MAKKPAAKKPSTKKDGEMKFGIEHFAKELGIEPASARVRLRNAGVKRAGKGYGWPTKEAMLKDVERAAPRE
jgi:hypothetical protein